MPNKKYSVISLFSGVGGLDLGFYKLGFKIIWAIDNNIFAYISYKKNFPKTNIIFRDIRKIENQNFPKTADIVIGGYPCQGFSEAGRQRLDDERNFLYKEFGRCLNVVQPKLFLAENVPGLKNMNGGKVLEQMIIEFEEKNYNVDYKLLNAKNFGVPQDRKRLFIVGVRKDLELNFLFPTPICGDNLMNYKTLKDTIWHIRDNPGPFYQGAYTHRYMARQRKRSWNQVSYCIVASADKNPQHPSGKLMKRINQNLFKFVGSNRTLSIKECLLIQTFPENFILFGPLIEQYRQVGNAVPPLLAVFLAKSTKNCLKRRNLCN